MISKRSENDTEMLFFNRQRVVRLIVKDTFLTELIVPSDLFKFHIVQGDRVAGSVNRPELIERLTVGANWLRNIVGVMRIIALGVLGRGWSPVLTEDLGHEGVITDRVEVAGMF